MGSEQERAKKQKGQEHMNTLQHTAHSEEREPVCHDRLDTWTKEWEYFNMVINRTVTNSKHLRILYFWICEHPKSL